MRPPVAGPPLDADAQQLPREGVTGASAGVPWRLQRATSSDRKAIARSSLTVLGRGVSKFAILIFLVIAARLLDKREFGIYSYVLVLTSTFGILADPQVSLIAARDVAAGRHAPGVGFWAALPAVTVTAVLSALGLLAFGLVEPGPGTTAAELLVAGLFVVFNRLFGLGTDMLRALGRFGLEAGIETGGTVLLVSIAALLAASGHGLIAVFAAFAGISALSALVCVAALRRDIGRPIRPRGRWRPLLRSGIKLSVAASATAVATRAPMIILGSVGSAAAVASYSAALRFADAAYLIALTLSQALLPAVAALAGPEPRRAAALTRRVILGAFIGGGALAAACAPVGSTLTSAVFGNQYASAGSLLSVVMVGVPFMGLFWISWFGLVAFDGERDAVKVSLAGAILSLLVGVAVIPATGPIGAAWTYVGALGLMSLGCYAMFELRARGAATRSQA